MGTVMDEASLAQVILTMSLQNAGFNTDNGKLDSLLADKIRAEQVIITIAPSAKRQKLIDILKKGEAAINTNDKIFLEDLIKDNANKFNDGRGQWD